METHYVRAVFDLDCLQPDSLPSYRIYVNDEIFAERTWTWGSAFYLEQTLQIQATCGEYTVKVEPSGVFDTRNHSIAHGPAVWQARDKLVVQS